MLDQAKVIEYAIKGINQELAELDKIIKKGGELINAYYKGETLKTKLTITDIENICNEKMEKVEQLEEMKNELKFQLLEI